MHKSSPSPSTVREPTRHVCLHGAAACSLFASCLLLLGCAGRGYVETSPLRVTEIHFNPSTAQGKAEFIEIANLSAQDVDVSGWQVTGAGRIVLPKGTVLKGGEALFLCRDEAAFKKAFPNVGEAAGILSGKLKNTGETVRIEDPNGTVVDVVGYEATDPEVVKADGKGLSLHRKSAAAVGVQDVWYAAAPTPGVVKVQAKKKRAAAPADSDAEGEER